ncbi:helix-turn-helix domain-containing protein [Streptomyces sp. NPDC001536]|uniref:helix-turn-helix domain-containing protein n=1 Tax=Streptomyces sp. NPDC001536 TaxID=3364583 RepID=UPI0036A244E7
MSKRAAMVTDEPGGPFKALPPGLHHHLRPFLTDITEEVVRAIRTEIPEYARPADDTYMQAVRRGVDHALQGFLERMAKPDTDWEPVQETYRRIGRGEAEEGRSLDSFQSALRLGARVTWRRVNALVDAELLPRNVLGAFGEALFLHLDEMAAATTAGYTEARLHAAGELQQRRTRLIDLLTADPPASAEAIAELAHSARWPVPRTLAVVAVDHGPPTEGGPFAPHPGTGPTEPPANGDSHAGPPATPPPRGGLLAPPPETGPFTPPPGRRAQAASSGADPVAGSGRPGPPEETGPLVPPSGGRSLTALSGGDAIVPPSVRGPIVPPEFLARFDVRPAVLIVPDPEGPGRARAVAGALQGRRAAMGPTVALQDGARSLRWAGEALELTRRGVLPDSELVRCQDHLATLLLLRDDALVDAMAERRLRPLDQVRPPQRERLAETLLSWLNCGHNASEVAVRLAVHPQTVRYRMRQLDELFGGQLHDPTAQFEMQLALRALQLRNGVSR